MKWINGLTLAMLPALVLVPQIAAAEFADLVGPVTTVWQVPGYESPTESTLAVGRDGQSILVWKDYWIGIPVLKSQRFAADGTPVGISQVLTEFDGQSHSFHHMVAAIASDGVATVAWEARHTFDAGDIRAVRLGSDGVLLGDAFTVHGAVDGAQTLPSIATDALNHVLITWTSTLDGGGHGVFGRLLTGWGGFQFDVQRIDTQPQPEPVRSFALMGDCCAVTVAWTHTNGTMQEVRAASFSLSWWQNIAERTLMATPLVDAPPRVAARMDRDDTIRLVVVDTQGVMSTQRFDEWLQPLGSAASGLLPTPPDATSPIWLGNGNEGAFALAWRQQGGWWTTNLLARFANDGSLIESREILGPGLPDVAQIDAMSADIDGDLVLAWQDGAQYSPWRSLRVGRFGGIPNAMAVVEGDWATTVIEPGSSFMYRPALRNFTNGPSMIPEVGILTGATFEVTLDPAQQLEGVWPASGWTCIVETSVVCSTPRVARDAHVVPVTLTLRAPIGGVVTNQLRLTHLETALFPELNATSQTLVVGDRTPDAFSFPAATGVPRNSVAESAVIVPTGFDLPTDLQVENGDVSINGAAYTCCFAELRPGDSVRLRHATPSTYATSRTTTLTIGGVSGSFTSTTEALDNTPDPFAFVDQNGLATNVSVVSAPVVIAGINAQVALSISGGAYSINGGAFMTVPTTVVAGDAVRVRVTSAMTASTAVHATLNVGGVVDTFTATTGNVDSTPDAFDFKDRTDVRRLSWVTSNELVVTGISTPVTISIAGGNARYAVNRRPYTQGPSSVTKGDVVRIQILSGDRPGAVVSTTLTIGGISDVWTVTAGR